MREVIRRAVARMAEAGVPSPEADAVALLAHVLAVTPGEARRRMILGGQPAAVELEAFDALVDERARRVPLQHLTGFAYFRHLELAVGPGVFIPRPETELTVDLVLQAVHSGSQTDPAACRPAPKPARVVDLCTGSGAIALAVKHEAPDTTVHAVELSEVAHAWAVRNQQALGLDVEILQGDATTAFPDLEGAVDVAVSNPPYIPPGAVPADPEVRDHDPELALYGGGRDGLATPLSVAARAAQLLRPGGTLVMEHADVQGTALTHALRRSGTWRGITDHTDLNGLPRTVTAVRR